MNKTEQLKKYYERCDEVYFKEHLKELLHKAKEVVEEIEIDDINLEEMVLVDVREYDEVSAGIIPAKTTLTIPRGEIEFQANEKIRPLSDKIIVCYCLKGARGLLAAKTLNDLGIKAKNLKGGISSWVEAKKIIKNYLGEFSSIL